MTGPSPEPRIPDEAVEAAVERMAGIPYSQLTHDKADRWTRVAKTALDAAWPYLRAQWEAENRALIERVAAVLAEDEQAVLKVAYAQTLISEGLGESTAPSCEICNDTGRLTRTMQVAVFGRPMSGGCPNGCDVR